MLQAFNEMARYSMKEGFPAEGVKPGLDRIQTEESGRSILSQQRRA